MHILIALFTLSALICVHELGHYLFARWAGVAVEEFAIGFGPILASYRGEHTLWTLRLFPLGGFVAPATRGRRSVNRASPLSRLLLLLGGVIGNFIGAVLILALILTIGKRMDRFDSAQEAGDSWLLDVRDARVYVASVVVDPTGNQPFLPGDEILKVNGAPTHYIVDVINYRALSVDTLQLTIRREGKVIPVVLQEKDMPLLDLVEDQLVQANPISALLVAADITSTTLYKITCALPSIFTEIFQEPTESLQGPVAIVAESAAASERGLTDLLRMAWVISVSLIVMNLLPIPGLDGGRILFLLPELTLRRKLNDTLETILTAMGAIGLLLLTIFVVINDIRNLL